MVVSNQQQMLRCKWRVNLMAISKLISIDEYEHMIEAGIFSEDERLELIKGEIVKMAAIGIPHEACVRRLSFLLHQLLGKNAHVSVQNCIRLPDNSQPEPDVALLKWRDDFYSSRRPTAEDVFLIIEVSESSLKYDRSVKARMYAEAGIPEMWIVNLPDAVLEVYSSPEAGAYRSIRRVGRGESLSLPGGLGGAVAVNDILG